MAISPNCSSRRDTDVRIGSLADMEARQREWNVRLVPEADVVVELIRRRTLCRPRPQPAIEQPPFALAGHEIDVAYKFCAALAPR
jgi:hypothetical protein